MIFRAVRAVLAVAVWCLVVAGLLVGARSLVAEATRSCPVTLCTP